jgi:hypothetical protein
MPETTRDEHMRWCKTRALEYVERGDGAQALASMTSDLGKHPELAKSAAFARRFCPTVDYKNLTAVRKFIEDFR